MLYYGHSFPSMPSTGRTIAFTILGLASAGFLAFAALVGYYLWQIKYHPELVDEPQPRAGSNQFTADPKRHSVVSGARLSNISAYIRQDSPSLGSPVAPVTILAFIDFECPFCQKSYPITKSVFARFAPVVRVVFKHLPIEALHPNAPGAALAAACAGGQGKFWPYYDRLFQTQKLAPDDLVAAPRGIGLDTGKFSRCLESAQFAPQIDQDLTDAAALGIRGTPTYFVNGWRVEGVISEEEWAKIILEELKAKR